eukprot:40186-Chlamydomonas_euryale.AAC.6
MPSGRLTSYRLQGRSVVGALVHADRSLDNLPKSTAPLAILGLVPVAWLPDHKARQTYNFICAHAPRGGGTTSPTSALRRRHQVRHLQARTWRRNLVTSVSHSPKKPRPSRPEHPKLFG